MFGKKSRKRTNYKKNYKVLRLLAHFAKKTKTSCSSFKQFMENLGTLDKKNCWDLGKKFKTIQKIQDLGKKTKMPNTEWWWSLDFWSSRCPCGKFRLIFFSKNQRRFFLSKWWKPAYRRLMIIDTAFQSEQQVTKNYFLVVNLVVLVRSPWPKKRIHVF